MKPHDNPQGLLFGLIAMLGVFYAIAAYFVLGHGTKTNDNTAMEVTMQDIQTIRNTGEVCREDKCRNVEIAQTDEERRIGLMGREFMEQDHGMLFIFDESKDWAFWMKDTLIPLDIIRLDKDLVVVDYITMQPCPSSPCPTAGPRSEALYVLELNAHQAKSAGFDLGSVLRFTRDKN